MAATEQAAPFTDAFPAASKEQWRQKVEATLKGAPLQKLVGRTYDGSDVQPLYPRAAGKPRAFRAAGDWSVVARLDHPEAAAANDLALTDLENGADGLQIVFAGSLGACGFGLKDSAALGAALDGVHLDAGLRVVLDLPAEGQAPVAALLDLVAARGYDPAKLDISVGLDPIGAAGARGSALDWSREGPKLAEQAKNLAAKGFAKNLICADGRVVHAAGGSPAQELAFALASALAALRALEAADVDLDDARKMIEFRLAADADEFLTIAKFRALRRQWAGIERACGLEAKPIRIHAETAWRMMTRRDPWVNLLRATVAVFSAGLGGADSVSVLPFTQALGLPDAFARRLARNTQLVLLEESNLGKVADPAAGAGGLEALTDALVERSYALFQDVEKTGGLPRALESGAFQAEVARTAESRTTNVARRKEALTGVSEFPDIHEKQVAVLLPAPAAPAAGEKALAPHRVAEPFEALRDLAESHSSRPKIFLANLGPVAAFTARATFAKNFFEAGGIEALGNDGFADGAALAEGFKASGAKLAVLCSSDTVYAERGLEAAKALAEAGAHLYLAGRPGEMETQWRAAGVRNFIFVGADVLTQLREALQAA
ncbi:methylmalonyl-CoA mutase family protein [Rhodoblastus acidophilus]|uniref:Methylmalonyl-CoA mutase family protein n=1 Tax=Candidatus Rhodoblastus alkanivorans TaxID=2954117 RepID=A0ABS9Z399_9HYPH|nr:methylmalonyl-CoA mutase family protein [Candidatus Rhodoblastus alkanivorans]MCI4678761.1 methylmalonyl-CoA mutase family protein [Candidatus Rhodoblastus alkanivorans]MCI4682150.1 methylmalonyl-CoA mutase family protein [Candidatus Rhodoblastus alkanivorans]MDI4639452.1 methylmalonyl-CoA mutase family protein [Rhodoblastus acidophilus]